MKTLKEIFRSYAATDEAGRHVGGTDKETNHHYGDAYERIFEKHWPACPRTGPKLVMEIGVTDGSSVLAWRECFPNAHCVAMDIHESFRIRNATPEDRVEFHLGDMRKLEDCERAAAGRQFDLIVEDATHLLSDSLRCLLYLWPHVRPGGLYIIEEFANIGALRENIKVLWPHAEIVDTIGPFGGVEPLVVLRKPL